MFIVMKVGNYQIGRYYAIIKKTYEDGSVDYETSFTDYNDLMQSVSAIRHCMGTLVGTATNNPMVLVDMEVVRGKENIEKELGGEILNEKLDKDILNKLKDDFKISKQDYQLATSEEDKNKALAACKKISDLLYQKFGIANYQG